MKKYIGLVVMAVAVLTGCTVEGTAIASQEPVAAPTESGAVIMLRDTFNITDITDENMRDACGVLDILAKDGAITEADLRWTGYAVASDTKFDWPKDTQSILAVIAVSSRFYCYEYFDMLGE
ncbi:hypothetical protein PBI_GRAYSON_237 [Rhodococcus phage Grayson]|nr:hypothetical protein PBI_GRAYSON_237 [Rhodococcus phage Grayson]